MGELKNEIHSLVDELNALSARNDDLTAEREQDAQTMNEMEAQVQEYKRKFDAVRIELRNLKGESVNRKKRSTAHVQLHLRCSSQNPSTTTIFPLPPTVISPMFTFLRSKPRSTVCCRLHDLLPHPVFSRR